MMSFSQLNNSDLNAVTSDSGCISRLNKFSLFAGVFKKMENTLRGVYIYWKMRRK